VGVTEALRQSGFRFERLVERGGLYGWARNVAVPDSWMGLAEGFGVETAGEGLVIELKGGV
jgi:hypothetical protein